MTTRKLRAFRKWMKSQGIDCSDALDLTVNTDSSVSVTALCDLHDGDVVARIPKESCLTVKTSGARQLIEEAELEGCLGLAVAIMYERSLGPLSPWFGYLQLLPHFEPIPLLWSVDEIDSLLAGTELHKIVKDDKALIHEDWKECIESLLTSASLRLKPEYFGVEEYLAAKSLIASRSFEVDDYHGHGMVPLADLFNHKTGAEDVHCTSVSSHSELDSDVDEDKYDNNKKGSAKRNSHSGGKSFSSDLESSDSELDNDAHNDKHENSYCEPTEQSAHSGGETVSESEGEAVSESDSESSSVSGDGPTVLEMIVVKEVKAGAEVFNTYGLSGNAALLHRYGFAEPDNQYDIVNLDMELVLQWSSSQFSHRYSRRRLALWRKLDYSGCVSQDSEYFEISFDGEPQVELLFLLYIILLPEEAYTELDLALSTMDDIEKSKGVKLSKKDNILFGIGSELSNNMLLTKKVRMALLSLADSRESIYGSNCLEDDIKTLNCCCQVNEPKLYFSLVLRISERRILKKLRCYASDGAMIRSKKGRRTRKRAKTA